MRRLVVAKVGRPRREPSRPFDLGRERHVPLAVGSEELEIVGCAETEPLQHEHHLPHLLEGLLGVEANNVVGHLGVLGERHALPKVALGARR